jgi:OmpA-OmpF porin, OOP family
MKHILLIIIGMALSIPAIADDFTLVDDTAKKSTSYGLKGRWGVGGGLGMGSVTGPDALKDGAFELDSKYVGSIWGRYHFTDRLGLELAVSRLSFEFADNTFSNLDPSMDLIDLSAAYRMWPQNAFHVLLQAGVGYARISELAASGPGNKEDEFAIKIRMGLEYMITHSLMLAVHGDYYNVQDASSSGDDLRIVSPTLALTYYFGRSKPAESDADGDGVIDSMDKCAGTVKGTNVGSDGCELTPAKVDTDNDGIADSDDRCPGTPQGQAINEFGCAKTEKLEITLNVQFNPGSSVIDTQFVSDLEKFADFLKKYPEAKAQIEGHTDNTGAEKLNYAISQKRAQAVVNHLVKKMGVDKKRITAKGYGPSQPVADNTSDEGRKKNRRVVAHVITEK